MNIWQKALLIETAMISSRVKLLTFKTSNKTQVIPGQYISIKTQSNTSERDYSIIPTDTDGVFQIAVTLIDNGEISPLLHQLKSGDEVFISGPKGNHFLLQTEGTELFCIAAGTGIAPFIGLVRKNRLSSLPKQITILISFKGVADYLFRDELERKDPSKSVFVTFTQEPSGLSQFKGRINKQMIQQITKSKEVGELDFFICGGSGFVEDTRHMLVAIGILPEKMTYERFG